MRHHDSVVFIIMVWFQISASRAQLQWWLYSRVVTHRKHDRSMCDHYRLTEQQLHVCLDDPQVMYFISAGTRIGVEHCQKKFENDRWMCNNSEDNKKLYRKKTRETAFLNAISTIGVIFKLVQECEKGVLKDCDCKRNSRPDELLKLSTDETLYWSFCKRHLQYAINITKIFLDPKRNQSYKENKKKRRKLKKVIFKHNNKAARKLVYEQSTRYKKCTCFGATGECIAKTCYRWLPKMQTISEELYIKYLNAVEVKLKSHKKLLPVNKKETVTKTDLIFNERINYCDEIKEYGIPGTRGRVCLNREPITSDDMLSCDILCCGRGATRVKRKLRDSCQCRFIWCCEVRCETCEKTIDEFVCN